MHLHLKKKKKKEKKPTPPIFPPWQRPIPIPLLLLPLQLSDKAVIALSDAAGQSSKAGAGLHCITLGILKAPCPKGFSCFADRWTDRTLQQLPPPEPGAAASPLCLCTAPLPPPAPCGKAQADGGGTQPPSPAPPPALPTSLLQHPGEQHEARQPGEPARGQGTVRAALGCGIQPHQWDRHTGFGGGDPNFPLGSKATPSRSQAIKSPAWYFHPHVHHL